ncbi:hypothetical protein GQR58_004075 [Nymphon striatum]|nr:hypothetical protein GQR58_004075 [Nymphon striatum]
MAFDKVVQLTVIHDWPHLVLRWLEDGQQGNDALDRPAPFFQPTLRNPTLDFRVVTLAHMRRLSTFVLTNPSLQGFGQLPRPPPTNDPPAIGKICHEVRVHITDDVGRRHVLQSAHALQALYPLSHIDRARPRQPPTAAEPRRQQLGDSGQNRPTSLSQDISQLAIIHEQLAALPRGHGTHIKRVPRRRNTPLLPGTHTRRAPCNIINEGYTYLRGLPFSHSFHHQTPLLEHRPTRWSLGRKPLCL